jgi:ABC-type lipoprotein release transport system permease subunit
MLLRMAWRNLWRHRTRTLILTTAVAFTYGLALVSMGMGDDGHQQMLEAAVEGAGGDVLVHAAGYWDSRSSDLVMARGPEILAAAEFAPGVRAAIPRYLVTGLVSSPVGTRPLMLQGIDPERERALRDYAEDLEVGAFLYQSERAAPILLGSILAEKLGLELGDRVVLTASRPDGEVTRALFHLTGILETGFSEVDEMVGLTTVQAAQAALDAGDALTQVGLLMEEGQRAETVAAAVRAALGARGGELEVLTWEEAVPEMVGFIEIDDAFAYIYLVVMFAIVAFAIANTFLMAVMERVREFGLLNALGLRGGGVARLLLTETALMTALAMAVGFALGYAGHLALSHWGLPAALWGVEEMELSGVDFASLIMRSRITPVKWIAASVLVAMVTVGSALYPAWRASRLAPAQAMRYFG